MKCCGDLPHSFALKKDIPAYSKIFTKNAIKEKTYLSTQSKTSPIRESCAHIIKYSSTVAIVEVN
jgi:hypothetical protein